MSEALATSANKNGTPGEISRSAAVDLTLPAADACIHFASPAIIYRVLPVFSAISLRKQRPPSKLERQFSQASAIITIINKN
jgi:hypothetical protein